MKYNHVNTLPGRCAEGMRGAVGYGRTCLACGVSHGISAVSRRYLGDISAISRQELFRLIAGLLHLGNIAFDGEDEAAVKGDCAEAVASMRELLGMPGDDIMSSPILFIM